MKGKYIEISNMPDFDSMDYFTYKEIKGPKKPNPFNYYLSKEDRKKAWKVNPYKHYTGVYFLMNEWELIYVGKTTKLVQRIKGHKNDTVLLKEFDGIFFLPIEEGWEMDILERTYIEMYQPKYNKLGVTE